MPANYPDWISGVTPNTHSNAIPTRTRSVVGVPAIRVRGARYRNCRPLDGVFELVNRAPQQIAGEERFEVYCAWFGVKPPTNYPRLIVRPGGYELLSSYTGTVIDNISDVRAVTSDVAPLDIALPEEADATGLVEGAVRSITVNAYERDPEARRRCIAAHGTTCCVCGFSFGAVYGPEAEGYIHVHHIKPLSEIGGEYVVDPVEDLRPVCPNCHAVLHLGGQCRSIEGVRPFLRSPRHIEPGAAVDPAAACAGELWSRRCLLRPGPAAAAATAHRSHRLPRHPQTLFTRLTPRRLEASDSAPAAGAKPKRRRYPLAAFGD